jgi:hypothetical protein
MNISGRLHRTSYESYGSTCARRDDGLVIAVLLLSSRERKTLPERRDKPSHHSA